LYGFCQFTSLEGSAIAGSQELQVISVNQESDVDSVSIPDDFKADTVSYKRQLFQEKFGFEPSRLLIWGQPYLQAGESCIMGGCIAGSNWR
jgi:hypothetical protein